MNNRILAVDPSGTGTTGIFIKQGDRQEFEEFHHSNWEKHWDYIVNLIYSRRLEWVVWENTHYLSSKTKDGTSLFRLLGALETIPLVAPLPLKVERVLVNQVKGLRNKLLKKQQAIAGINYQPGKGWHHYQKKISTHELDAYLVYFIWKDKPKNELMGKTIETTKIKQNIRANDQ